MTRPWKGRIAVDIRESAPDWEPFVQPRAPEKEAQFYSMLGQRGLYSRGWLANTVHPPLSGWSGFEHDVWELYRLKEDRSQMRNLAEAHPDTLERLKGLWFYYAGVYKGLPLDDRSFLEMATDPRPLPSKPRNRYIYYPETADVPEPMAVSIRRRSCTIVAGAVIETPEAEGVLFAHGGVTGGYSLYIKERKLHYLCNWLGEKFQTVTSEVEVPTGKHAFTAEFAKTGDDEATMSALGTLTLYINMEPVGRAPIMIQPGFFSLTGEGVCVGRDRASPVSPDDRAPFRFTGGTIDRVVVDVSGEDYVDHGKEVAAGLMRD